MSTRSGIGPYIHQRPSGFFRAEGPLFAAALLWGLSFVFLKNALDDLPVHFILAVRFTGAALLLLPVFGRRIRAGLNWDVLIRGAIMGTILFGAYSVQTLGLKTIEPGKNAFLTAVYVVLVPFLDWVVKKRRPDAFSLSAAVLCIGGVGLVTLESGTILALSPGDALTLLSGVLFALHLTYVAHASRTEDPLLITWIQFGVTALWCWLIWFVFEPAPTGIPMSAVYEIAYLTVFATAASLLLQSIGQKHTNPAPAAVILSLEAVFGVVASVVLYGEHVTLSRAAGFVLIFFAVVLSQTKLRFFRRRSADPQE